MSAVARTVGQIAGSVAAIAQFIPGGQLVAAIAGGIALVSGVVAQLTAKPPAAQGAVNERLIGANNPLPYLMGEAYSAGVQVHDVGYGGRVSKVENPYRFIPVIYSCAGPIDGLVQEYVDFNPVTFGVGAPANAAGYYNNFLYRDFQNGASPELNALAPQWPGAPDWGAEYLLSGMAAIGWSARFDGAGKVFAGGLTALGAVFRGVRAYDPRLDSTYPGGAGAHRINDESTWSYTANPALHALAYAFGRYQNGRKIFGVDLGENAIPLPTIVAWANVCDLNGWVISGTIFEPGDKYQNLKRICQAGGGEPVTSSGLLSFRYEAPRIPLDRISADDIAEDGLNVSAMQSWRDAVNGIVPRYRSNEPPFDFVQGDEQIVAAFELADGEPKIEEIQYELVPGAAQGAQLARYEVYRGRAAGPFTLPCKPRLTHYRAGDVLTLDVNVGLWPTDIDVLIVQRSVNTATGVVTFEAFAEIAEKHADSLGASSAPPVNFNVPPVGFFDGLVTQNNVPVGYETNLIATSSQTGLTISANDSAITISAHTRVYSDKMIAVAGAVIGSLAANVQYHIYYDDENRAGGAVAWAATTDYFAAQTSANNPNRHYAGSVMTDIVGGGGTTGGGSLPPGGGGYDPYQEP